ncbi:MAG: AbrB/MazE/SpoVT family DNA-binding domain-containing protein [Candidatus Omnitrophica bacterium]|nr:AbrB/MazE/SpoVT family DNA-binding domain-containing protein [Candidatus Omnitrophota bacterium]
MGKFPFPKMYGAVTVGERGQVVIPAEIRKVFGIKNGDKLLVFAKPGGPIGLIPAEEFSQFLEHASGMLAAIKKHSSEAE